MTTALAVLQFNPS